MKKLKAKGMERQQTGGGSPPENATSEEEKVLDILGWESIRGVAGGIDTDAPPTPFISTASTSTQIAPAIAPEEREELNVCIESPTCASRPSSAPPVTGECDSAGKRW